MSKTDYILIPNAKIVKVRAKNPGQAYEQYKAQHPDDKNIVIMPQSAVKLNGKRIPLHS